MPNKNPERAAPRRLSRGILLAGVLAVIGLAGILFLFGRSTEITVPLSVTFVDLPEKLLVVSDIPVMEVRAKGPVGFVKSLKDTKLYHSISLASAQPGKLQCKISPHLIEAPQGITLLEVHPNAFFVSIDNRIKKRVPVVPELLNDPVSGYEVTSVTASPETIHLSGPANILADITAVRTTPIDLAAFRETTQKQVALNLNYNPHVEPLGNGLINITIEVQERIMEVSMLAQVQGIGTAYRYAIEPKEIQLVVRGPENTLKNIAQGNGMRIHVDLQGLKPGTYMRPAAIEPPLNTSVVAVEPEEFAVTIID
jgi:YbbR domain-containing protein